MQPFSLIIIIDYLTLSAVEEPPEIQQELCQVLLGEAEAADMKPKSELCDDEQGRCLLAVQIAAKSKAAAYAAAVTWTQETVDRAFAGRIRAHVRAMHNEETAAA